MREFSNNSIEPGISDSGEKLQGEYMNLCLINTMFAWHLLTSSAKNSILDIELSNLRSKLSISKKSSINQSTGLVVNTILINVP